MNEGTDPTGANSAEGDTFRRMFEDNNAVMLLFDVESSRILDANPAAAAYYGYPRELIRSLSVFDIVARPSASFREDMDRILAHEMTQKFTSTHRLASGEVRDVEVHPTPLTIDGRPVMFSIISDASEEIRAKRALAESEARLRAVIDSLPFDIWLCDANGRYIIQNSVSVARWGNHAGQNPGEAGFSEEITRLFLDNNLRALSGEIVTGEVSYLLDGERRDYYNVLAPLRLSDQKGPIDGIVGVNVDITDRIRAEASLLISLEEKEVLLREVHHRVKNNLQVVSSLLRLQTQGITDEPARQVFLDAEQRVRAMATVHDQLYRSTNLAAIDFGAYLSVMTPQLIRSLGTHKTELSLDVVSILLNVDIAIPCGLILNELVTNVLKHAFRRHEAVQHDLVGLENGPMDKAGRITVSLRRVGPGTVELAVQDDGLGFPKDADIRRMSSMGMTLVTALTRQIAGTVSLERPTVTDPDGMERREGSRIVVQFPA
ncbi:MAG TPA: histidine kinase dimerization/phosphoacceptor domain -containing protein [Spirochaetia bacterium]|nr:histidine kinase dimerization/phosphoacceptor domain -containing protein [Spirochaetia bacterium]